MEGKRRQRRAKSEALDGRKWLSRLLRVPPGAREGWRVVQVPSGEAADGRHLPRDRESLKQARARTPPRRKGGLRSPGRRLTSRSPGPEHRDALRLWAGAPMPRGLRRRGRRVHAPHQCVSGQLAEGEAARRAVLATSQEARLATSRQLMPLRGLGIHGARLLVREFFGWRAVKTRREGGASRP